MDRIPVYVINDFLRFERKLYSLFGVNLGRSIQFKTISYFVGAFGFLFILSLIPVIGAPFAAIPILVKIGIAAGAAYLLTDVGTENRPPVNAFVSFVRYHWMVSRKESYYQGKVMSAPPTVKFTRAPKVQEESFPDLQVQRVVDETLLRLPAPK